MLGVSALLPGQRMVTPDSPEEEKTDGIQLREIKPLLKITSTPDVWKGYGVGYRRSCGVGCQFTLILRNKSYSPRDES